MYLRLVRQSEFSSRTDRRQVRTKETGDWLSRKFACDFRGPHLSAISLRLVEFSRNSIHICDLQYRKTQNEETRIDPTA